MQRHGHFSAASFLPPRSFTPTAPAAPPTVRGDGLTEHTARLLDDYHRSLNDFEAQLAKQGLSLETLEQFAEKYLDKHPDRARLRRDIEAKLQSTAVPATTPPSARGATRGASIPKLTPAHLVRI
jgi:hypothetical protein